tara:strand:- start:296 stop:1006 length:711 start_codon:yes stop_codon:yes gene_type:complete
MAEKSLYTNHIERIRNSVKSVAGYRQASPAIYEIAISFRNAISNRRLDTMSKFEIQSRLSDSCENVSIPGRGQSSQANTIYGPTREMPYQPLYSGDLDMTFRVGADYLERQFFEDWSDIVVSKGNNYEYYDSYIADVQVRAIGRNDDLLYECRLLECYPKNIGAIDLGYEKVDDLTRFTVSLAFRRYEISYAAPLGVTPQSSGNSGLNLPDNIGGPGGAPSYGGPNAPGNGDTAIA